MGDILLSFPWENEAQILPLNSIALLGFPYDEGCRRNLGRVGAASGITLLFLPPFESILYMFFIHLFLQAPASMRALLPKLGAVANPGIFIVQLT
jgi:hypothetical protein